MMDLDPESRRILELARAARTPGAHDKARVERRFALALGLTAGAASGAASAQTAGSLAGGKSAASAVVLKWWVAGGGAALAAAIATYAALPAPSAPAPVGHDVPRVAAAQAVAPTEPPAADAPAASAPAADATVAHGSQRTLHAEHRRRAGASLAAELDLLHRAQQAWRGREATRALALVDEHRARYPHSELRTERDALQVLALCELGRTTDAARVGRALLAREPRSPLRASIEQSCALK